TLNFPSFPEQKRIGSLFSVIDRLIDRQRNKLEKLQTFKQAMLEKMFPKEGSLVPEIRFRGFTDPWEQRKLGDVVSLRGRIGFRGYKETDLVSKGQGAITFSPSDIDEMGNVSNDNNKYLSWEKYDESPEIQVQVGDILFTKTASIGKIGYVRELKEKATINPQFALLTPNENSNGYFTFLAVRSDDFMKQVRGITGGSSVPTMSQEKLKELIFMSPSIKEQKCIGLFIENIDNLIILHLRKLEKLQAIKRSLLQKMFV
ncbi:MAG: restriction endonuclease subunit S, partial [Thermoguttaceae bacterium]|nr:restriction endonuclease subunit S [Thermoguttaceae bacterium]